MADEFSEKTGGPDGNGAGFAVHTAFAAGGATEEARLYLREQTELQKNRSDLALAKFEEAAAYAPKWARLHLKWGEALWWAGRKDEARAQFAMALSLGLAPAEAGQLARYRNTHA
jgi:Flp pilus assembly protein TadD